MKKRDLYSFIVAAVLKRYGIENTELRNALAAKMRVRVKRAVVGEREACADLCDAEATIEGIAQRCAAAIRARK